MFQPAFRPYFILFLWCAGATVLLHCPMLFKRHAEGDELVYYVLSQQMGWDLSNYTTKDDPRVNTFPYTIYRAPLFHHPPLLPYVLKVGSHFTSNPLLSLPRVAAPGKPGGIDATVPSSAVAMAFLFAVFVCIAALWYTCRLLVLLKIEPPYGAAALVGLTLCPLVLFSTTRIHHDGLAGLLLLCGFVAFTEALDRNAVRPAIEAALWFVAALNIRFNAIVALPLILLMPVYALQRTRVPKAEAATKPRSERSQTERFETVRLGVRWQVPAIVLIAIATLGLQHYYRLLWVDGTIWPWSLIQPVGDVARFSPYLALVEKMDRSWICAELAVLFPLAFLFVAPWNIRQYAADWRTRQWSVWFVFIFAFLFVTQLYFSYKPVRYFAAVTPLMFVCWPYLLRNTPPRDWFKWGVWGMTGITLLLMVTTGFLNATLHDPDQTLIVPSLTIYWPPLLDAYRLRR